MRKLILFFFSLFFLFTFSSSSVAAYTKCYMGDTEVGHMHTYFDDELSYESNSFGRRTMNFVVNGKRAAIEFWIDQDYINKDDPQLPAFKLGNSDWLAKNYVWWRVENWNGGIRYIAWFEVPDDNLCGPCWANVEWRALADGNTYYCTDLTYKYRADGYIDDYINLSCINNSSGCEVVHSGARKAYFPEGYYFKGTISNSVYCNSFKLCLDNGAYSQCGIFTTYSPGECLLTSEELEWPVQDRVRYYIAENEQNPPPDGVNLNITTAEASVYFFDFISDNYCGGNLGGGGSLIPVPSSACPLSLQQTSFSGSGTALENRYDDDQYTTFVSNKTGYIDKAEIYVYLSASDPSTGARGNKILTCKITDASGGTTLGESLPNDGPFDSENTWVPVYFDDFVDVIKNNEYRIYCKVENKAGGGFIYWLDFWNNKTDKTRKIYICPRCPFCPLAVWDDDVPRYDGNFNKFISWNDVEYENGYKIYLCSTPNPLETCTPTYLTSLGADTTSYTATNGDQGFAPGTKVIYEIKPFSLNSECNELSCEWRQNDVPVPTPTPTPTEVTPTPTPTPSENAWFQTQEGDVHAEGEIFSKVSEGDYFSLEGTGGYPGLVSYQTSASFSPGEVSSKGWLVKDYFDNYFDYDYFYEFLGSPSYQSTSDQEIPLPSQDIAAYNGNFKTSSSWDVGTRKIVVLINGKFLIKDPITINQGGSLLLVASQGIGVSKDITSLSGLFFTDQAFYSSVENDFTANNFVSVSSNQQLIIYGGVYASSFDLARDLGYTTNQTTPAEKFTYQPNLLLNLHYLLWQRSRLWQEEVP